MIGEMRSVWVRSWIEIGLLLAAAVVAGLSRMPCARFWPAAAIPWALALALAAFRAAQAWRSWRALVRPRRLSIELEELCGTSAKVSSGR